MGIASGAAELLLRSSNKIKFRGKLLQLGNQKILCSKNKFIKLKYRYHKEKIKFDAEKKFDSDLFFKLLNFSNVDSLDVNSYENATIIEDLNLPIKKKYYKNFDFIYDGGSLEHIFNISEALNNISRILKTNGYIMHLSPVNNYIDHGFYSINPTLLKDYYEQNNFKILEINLIKQNYNLEKKTKWEVFEYEPSLIRHYKNWKWKENRMLVWLVAKKTNKSAKIVIPTQSKYVDLHKKKKFKNKKNLKGILRNNYPRTFYFLKKAKNSTSGLINLNKNKNNIKKIPKLIFKCE